MPPAWRRHGRTGRVTAAALATGLLVLIVHAAGPRAQPRGRREQPFRSSIDLTTVTATVVDREGRLVANLPRDAFDVFEDGQPVAVSQFTSERVPVSLAILLDVSDSMFGRRIQQAREAIERFLGDLLDPADEHAIVVFNHQQRLLSRWTDAGGAGARVLDGLRPTGATAIYDAILAALPLAEARHRQRAALLVISDGADTASDAALRDVRSALLRSDAFVYAIAIDSPDRTPINAQVNPTALREITDQSGGRTIVVRDAGDAITALTTIAGELNSQYLLGYSSPKGADGQYHRIRVRVHGTDHRVRARNGYVAVRRRPSPDQ